MFSISQLAVMTFFALYGIGYSESNITSDTYFYGNSEPVYPSPNGTGTGDWASAYKKAIIMVSQMTLEEKNNLTYGSVIDTNGCSGWIPPIPRLGFTGLCLNDAGNGVRSVDFVNSYPSGIHVGASWNKLLAHDRGWYMGGEFKTKGVQVALGPVVGPLGRLPTGGRNWESPSNDPYLGGIIGAATVQGIQAQGVITSVKHFIGNEQELFRQSSIDDEGEIVESISSNIDDKTLHELYLWPFQDVLKAGAGNIMCSYNRVNNSYSCQNSKLLNGLLKTELGFNGWVITDWDAQHSGAATALAGCDMAMPDGQSFWGANFTEAYINGSVPMSRLNDMATRIIATWYKMGQDAETYPKPGIGVPYNVSEFHTIVNALSADSKPTIFEGAVEGHVLVKNKNDALPLKSPQLISVIGYDAVAPGQYMPSVGDQTANKWKTGLEPAVFQSSYVFGANNITKYPENFQVAYNGTLSVGGGSGANSGPYISAPLDALQQRAYEDNTVVYWDTIVNPAYGGVMKVSDACLVFINAFATESEDRSGTYDIYSDELVNNAAAWCEKTIVIIHNAGIRLVESFVDNENVTAIIYAHLPGQDSGRALVSLIYGENNFSGKLPYTVAKNESDYPAYWNDLNYAPHGLYPQSNFTEGVYIDYRHFDLKRIVPRYEFGFGLSYTNFSFSDIKMSCHSIENIPKYPSGPIQQGGAADLWDVLVIVTATLHNIGNKIGAEVAQLYVGIPGGPVKQLRGFEKVNIAPGQSAEVSFPLTRRDLSSWDVLHQKWSLQSGSYSLFVGSSSRNLPLAAKLSVAFEH